MTTSGAAKPDKGFRDEPHPPFNPEQEQTARVSTRGRVRINVGPPTGALPRSMTTPALILINNEAVKKQ